MRSLGGMAFWITGLVFLGSVVAFGATVVDAVRVEEVPASSEPASRADPAPDMAPGDAPPGLSERPADAESPATTGRAQGPFRGITYPRVTEDEILDAVNQDLFQPDRTPPVERYLLPSERVASTQDARDPRRQREPNLRIVGTALAGNLALAVVQLEDSIPFAVLLGEEVDGYLLAAVYEESVTLTGDGSEFTLAVMEPQRGSSSENQGRNNRNARNDAALQDAARALQERVQQMMQGRGQVGRGGQVPGQAGVQLQFTPGGVVLQNGRQLPGTGGVVVRTRPGGGGGGGSLP